MNFVLLPYSVILAQFAVFRPNKRNIIHPKGVQLDGERKVAVGNCIDISEVKDALKKKKVSINDYILVASSLAMSQIATDVNRTQVSIPFTLKDYPKRLEDIRMGNDFSSLPFTMKFPEVRELSSFK